jgi:hypothetical protein
MCGRDDSFTTNKRFCSRESGRQVWNEFQWFPEIPGADAVVAWFGHWPSFENAEVLSVVINRGGLSMIRIHAWNLSARVDRAGYFLREREAIVVFEFAGIKSLRLRRDCRQTERRSPGRHRAHGARLSLRICAITWALWRTDRRADCCPRRAWTLSRFLASRLSRVLIAATPTAQRIRTRDSRPSRAARLVVQGCSTRAGTSRS